MERRGVVNPAAMMVLVVVWCAMEALRSEGKAKKKAQDHAMPRTGCDATFPVINSRYQQRLLAAEKYLIEILLLDRVIMFASISSSLR